MTTYKIRKTRQETDVSTFSLADSVLLQCSEMRSNINVHEIKGQIVESIESCLLIWKKIMSATNFLKDRSLAPWD